MWALASAFFATFSLFLAAFFCALPFSLFTALAMAACSSSSVRWAYQTSIVDISANCAIEVR